MTDAERLRSASPSDLAAVIGYGVTEALIGRLAASQRFAGRLLDVAAARLNDLGPLNARQSAALALTPITFRVFACHAGGVWRARALARVIDGAVLRHLTTVLGSSGYSAALEGQALAPQASLPDLPFNGGVSEALRADGEACWAAWSSDQPSPVAERLALLGGTGATSSAHKVFGPAIIDWLLDRSQWKT